MKGFHFAWFAVAMAAAFGIYYIQDRVYASSEKAKDEFSGAGKALATFAGGCFWCTESDFEKVDGIIEVVSGYSGGSETNPTYEMVSAGMTGHLESIQVTYDPDRVSYEELLEIFWKHVDPTDSGGQFVDRGHQYLSAVFYHDDQQKRLAEASKERLAASGKFDKPIVTKILPYTSFFMAEDYHQDYYRKNPGRYKTYRFLSGRDQFLKRVWGDDQKSLEEKKYSRPDDGTIREKLTPLQYTVTQENGTEPPFQNEYWDNKEEGIYVDVVSGEPLFSSRDKFDSGSGWPSFTRPLFPENVVEKKDRSHFMVRTEIRSRHGNSHLGHVFDDGPGPGGLRYCINSAALRFIPREALKENGFSEDLLETK